ncbi:hypothetical protein GU927_003160 [Rhodobacteraceae bacterium HSP-20]|jgi:hypothetical protein|uniref:Uncharacterized protein n=1 Tax=Paragemmobacter amnigenus TaxID=2852097 RepID=A0ABS6J379_9RHOB|nr:hypothetical protein [Rhodobacter amnigenus]MBU9696840.1 hypothetical protein [Rhodobacter amnigenus]MBV4388067.1 hypothetical protein [Rhodobacter amnigenus]
MHRPAALLLAATLCLPALAQEATPVADAPLAAAEFEAYATGKTLSYAQDGVIWGAEQYLPGRKVIWAFTEDDCQYGHWFEDRGNICFVYDADPEPQCWRFFREATGLRAIFMGADGSTSLSEVGQSSEPLHCPGPDLGV